MLARKFFVIGAVFCALTALASVSAVSARDDDETPLHKLMVKVQQSNTTILGGTRNAANYKKKQEDVVKAAEELAKLGKEAKKFTEPAKEKKKEQKDWEDKSDAFVKEVEKFSALLADKATDQAKAKAAYKDVGKKCTECHDIYKPDVE